MPRLFPLAVALFCTGAALAADSRAGFLKLVSRPRVDLAPTVAPPVTKDGVAEFAFSYQADADQRVPGLLFKPAASSATASSASPAHAPTSPSPSTASSSAPVNSPARRPVIIALHGTGGNKESQRALLTDYVRAGFIGVAIDGRYHGARASGSTKEEKARAYSDAILRAYRAPGKEYPFFFDTAWDVIRLVDYLATRDDVDATRIGVIGFSKGGIEAYLAAAADPRLAVVVPCIGVQSFGWATDHDAWQSRIGTIQSAFDAAAREAGVAKPDGAFLHAFYDRIAPGITREFDGPAMLPLIAPRPLLMINGEIDARTPMPGLQLCIDAGRRAYAAAGAQDAFVVNIQPNTAHKVNPDSLAQARAWFIRWLRP